MRQLRAMATLEGACREAHLSTVVVPPCTNLRAILFCFEEPKVSDRAR